MAAVPRLLVVLAATLCAASAFNLTARNIGKRALVGMVKNKVGNRQGWQEDDTFTPNPNYVEVTKSGDDGLSGGAITPSNDCVCVAYYQCDENHYVIQDGVGIIDIRQKEGACEHYLDSCCKLRDDQSPSPGPTPGPTPDPWATEPTPQYPPPPVTDRPRPQPQPQPQPTRPTEPQIDRPHPTPPARAQLCGQRNPDGVGFRITGGEDGEAQFGEFPWMVAILKVEKSDDDKTRNLYQCGGALIAPEVVLTAAHCVKNKNNPSQLKIRAGEWDTQTSKEMYHHQDRTVRAVSIHPEYYAGAVHNDVALLFLETPVHIGYHIGTICMPEQNQIFDYEKCFVSGWGKDKFGQQGRYQVILKKLELPVVPHNQCQEQLRKTRLGAYFTLHDSFICAGGEEGKDTCKGDGGSPLVCPIHGQQGRYQLAGTVAWGIDCGLAGVPGVYGNVALFRNWVDKEMANHFVSTASYETIPTMPMEI